MKPRVVYNTKVMLPSAKKDSVPTTQKSCVVYEFSCRCEARYVGRTTQRLADRIKQHIPTSIRKKNTTIREQPPRMCKNSNSKMKNDSAIGQTLIKNPECAKTYSDYNFRIIGQARSSFHLSALESVYIKTQNPVLCKQIEFIFSLGLLKYTMVNRCQVANHMANWTHYSSYHLYPHLAINFGSPFGRYPTFHTLTSVGRKKGFSVWLKHGTAFSCCSEVL